MKSVDKPENSHRTALPARHREDLLPFERIHEDDFERACRDIALIAFPKLQPELKERRGKKQYEVDVECFNAKQYPEVVIQSKRYKTVTPTQFGNWIDQFIRELSGYWKDKNVSRYILAVTVEGNSDKIREKCREAYSKLAINGVIFEPWFLFQMTNLVKHDKSFIDRYFHSAWIEAISSSAPNVRPETAVESSANGISSIATDSVGLIGNLMGMVTEEVERSFGELDLNAKQGHPTKLRVFLMELTQTKVKWDALAPPLKAKVLRRLSLFAVNEGNARDAEMYFERSKEFAAPPDLTTEAHVIHLRDGLQSAITFLRTGRRPAEKEVLASLLIVLRDNRGATEILKSLPQSAEQQRLLALAELTNDDRTISVEHAKCAVSLHREAYGTHLALFFAHFNAALVNGSSVDVALSPNPFNPALAREDSDAVSHLNEALNIIGRLTDTTEQEIANELKAWNLAVLACHPHKAIQTRSFAKQCLENESPTAVFIAWCLRLGIKVQYGKLRKLLEDRLRNGQGDPTDVVVMAMLIREMDGDGLRAVKAIEKYKTQFSDAADFFETWRTQLSNENNVELLVQVGRGISDEFDELAKEAVKEPIEPEHLISTGQILQQRKAFDALLTLKDELLKLGNANSVELVIASLIETGEADEAINILDANSGAFLAGENDQRLLRLRAYASERSGLQGDALKFLEHLDAQKSSLQTKLPIISKSVMLGHTERLLRHGRELLKLPDTDGHNYLALATAVKDADPQLTRDLVQRYLSISSQDPAHVPTLIQLDNEVGLSSLVQDAKFIELHNEFFNDSAAVRRFDSVEEVLAFVEEQTTEQRNHRKPWLTGQMSCHQAFGGDPALFAKLYLSEASFIRSSSGDLYPPLLRAGGLEKAPIPTASDKTSKRLVLDISGILTAARYELLDQLEREFDILIPEALLPTALEMQSALLQSANQISLAEIAKFARFQAEQRESLDVLGSDQNANLPKARRVVGEAKPDANLMTLLAAIKRDGRLDDVAYQNLLEDIQISEKAIEIGHHGESVDVTKLHLDGGLLMALIRQDCVRIFAEYTSITICQEDYLNLGQFVTERREEHRLLELISRSIVQIREKLQNGRWRTVAQVNEEEGKISASAPNAMHCFMASLSQVLAGSDALIWIEDRWLSRHQMPTVVTLDQIVNYLLRSDRLSNAQVISIENQRAKSGQGFLDIGYDEVFSSLKKAPIQDGVLFETENLRSQRVIYTRQLDYLQYIDWQEKRHVGGRLIGDPRYAIDAIFLVPNVIRKIWTDEDICLDDKHILSAWVWAAYRVESFPTQNYESAGLEQYRSNVVSLLIQMTIWPLFDKFANNLIDWQQYTQYYSFLSQVILAPRLEVDDNLSDIYVTDFIRVAKSLMREDGDIRTLGKDERRKLKIIYAREISDLLDMLPSPIKTKILKQDHFSDELFIELTHTVNTPKGSYSARSISDAIDKALKSRSKIKTALISTLDGKKHKLIVKSDPVSTPPEVYISQGKGQVALSELTVTVTLPKAEERRSAFVAISERIKTATSVLKEVESAVINDDNIEIRLDSLNHSHSLDFAFAEDDLRRKLRAREPIDKAVFDLASPTAILNYLRLDPQSTHPVPGQLASGYALLANEMGVEVADARYAACPIPIDEKNTYSPMRPLRGDSMFQFARALRKGVSAEDGNASTLNEDVDRFCEMSEWQTPLFVALVQRGALQALSSENWKTLPGDLAISLIWIWADRMCASFAAEQIDLKAVASTVNELRHSYLRSQLAASEHSKTFATLGIGLSDIDVLARLCGYAEKSLGQLSDCLLRKKLFSLLGTYTDDKWMPHLRLMFAKRSENQFREAVDLKHLDTIGLIPSESVFPNFDREKFIEEVLAQAEEAEDPIAHLAFFALAHPFELSNEQIERISTTLADFLNGDKVNIESSFFRIALDLFAKLTGFTASSDLFKSTMGSVVTHIFSGRRRIYIGAINGTAAKIDDQFSYVFEALYQHVKNLDLELDCKLSTLFEYIEWLMENWPGSEAAITSIASNCFEKFPSEIGHQHWQSFNELRKRAVCLHD